MNPTISVIVPVYNVEKYLKCCLDSILAQSFRDFELILIDDGSPDRCGEICDEYAKSDERVVVIHKENGGVSDARNVGIERATGEYLAFVDGDDYISPECLSELYAAVVSNECDMAECAIRLVSEGDCSIYDDAAREEIRILKPREHLFEKGNIYYHLVLYSSSLFSDIRFPVGKYYEDSAIIYKLIYSSRGIARLGRTLYYYRRRDNSLTTADLSRKKILDSVDIQNERVRFFKENKENDIWQLELARNCVAMIEVYRKAYRKEIPDCSVYDPIDLYRYVKERFRKIERGAIPKRHYLYIKLFLLMPHVFSAIGFDSEWPVVKMLRSFSTKSR